MNRLSPLFVSRDPTLVYNEIDRLRELYQRIKKKALPESLLLFASWGGSRRGEISYYGITLMWEDDAEEVKAAEWVKENVGESKEGSFL